METMTELPASVSTSLEDILEQMEVSTGSDLHSLHLITACSEDLLLGGEVEIRDVVDVKSSLSAGGQRGDANGGGPADHDETTTNTGLLLQGGAEGEGERLEEAIGMEVEVTRKSSSGSPTPTELESRDHVMSSETGTEWEGAAAAAATTTVDQHSDGGSSGGGGSGGNGSGGNGSGGGGNSGSGGGDAERDAVVHRERPRRKELYIPPVTEWRDFLDSQDMLQEYTRNTRSGGGEEEGVESGRGCVEEGETEGGAEERQELEVESDEEIEVGGGEERVEEGGSTEEMVGEKESEGVEEGEGGCEVGEEGGGVEGDKGFEEGREEGGSEGEERGEGSDEDEKDMEEEGGEEGEEIVNVEELETRDDDANALSSQPAEECRTDSNSVGEPLQLEMFIPPRTSPYRHPSPPAHQTTTLSRSRDLEIAEMFLDKERELLRKAKCACSPSEASRQPIALVEEARQVTEPETRHRGGPYNEVPSVPQSRPEVSLSDRRITSKTRHQTCPPTSATLGDTSSEKRHIPEETGTASDVIGGRGSVAAGGGSSRTARAVVDVSLVQPGHTRQPVVVSSVQQQRPHPSHVSSYPEDPVTSVLTNEEASDSSFFEHESQMITREVGGGGGGGGEEEEERQVVLCSPSEESSEYETAVEVLRTPIVRDPRLLSPNHQPEALTQRYSRRDGAVRGNKKPVKGRVGRVGSKGKGSRPKECSVNIQRIALNRLVDNRALSEKKYDILDFLSHICPRKHAVTNVCNFDDFLERLQLPSISHSEDRRGGSKCREGRLATSSGSNKSSHLSSQFLLMDFAAPVTPRDGWSGIDDFVSNLPTSLFTGGSDGEREKRDRPREGKVNQSSSLQIKLRRDKIDVAGELMPPPLSSLQPAEPPASSQEAGSDEQPPLQRECPLHIQKIIHGFWFRNSIALSQATPTHHDNHS